MKKYRVEAFIIPTNVIDKIKPNDEDAGDKLPATSPPQEESPPNPNSSEELKAPVVVDSQDVLNASTDSQEEQSSSELSGVFFDINEHIYDEIKAAKERERKPSEKPKTSEQAAHYKANPARHDKFPRSLLAADEPIYDEPFVGSLTSRSPVKPDGKSLDPAPPGQSNWTLASSKYRRFGIVAPKIPKRSSSLQSISEGIESFDESHFLQQLQHRQRDNEQSVCCHGRKDGCLTGANQRPEDISDEIFKENWMQRLDALRKLETLLKDKEVALQSRERLLFKKEKELRILERLVKDKMRQAELYAKRCKKSLSSGSEQSLGVDSRSLPSRTDVASSSERLEPRARSRDSLLEAGKDEPVKQLPTLHPANPRNSSGTNSSLRLSQLPSRMGSTRSRSRQRQKIRYEDLDSTLSADIGDSSFIVTSRKFDPMIFKKPMAFTRSASERRPRSEQRAAVHVETLIKEHADESSSVNVLEEKALKKISENIIASQNQESKFLNYGLIDGNAVSAESLEKKEIANQKRFSYLNLESINKTIKSRIKAKERPISWSEDTDDWLKKKRLEYNTATKHVVIDNAGNKENFDRQSKIQKSIKITKKKENNHKKFSIFR